MQTTSETTHFDMEGDVAGEVREGDSVKGKFFSLAVSCGIPRGSIWNVVQSVVCSAEKDNTANQLGFLSRRGNVEITANIGKILFGAIVSEECLKLRTVLM